MSVVLLVRHAQASFGAADYDVLSDQGEQQARWLGEVLGARGLRPSLVVSGRMQRQRRTAELVVQEAGLRSDVEEDPGFDEYDHRALLSALEPVGPEGVEEALTRALERWVGGAPGYAESFTGFAARVEEALRRTTERLGQGETALVVSSGGPISWVTTRLLGGDATTWRRLNTVAVNTGITKLVVGRRGTTVLSFNEHAHLEGPHAGLLSYR